MVNVPYVSEFLKTFNPENRLNLIEHDSGKTVYKGIVSKMPERYNHFVVIGAGISGYERYTEIVINCANLSIFGD